MNQNNTDPNVMTHDFVSSRKRDRDYFSDISGTGFGGHPKARVILRYFNKYTDGTTEDIEVLTYEKPTVTVFRHVGFVNVLLDFGRREDMDLRTSWHLLETYSSPLNSVDYLPEEIESGYYDSPFGKQQVYIPLLQLSIRPIGKESSEDNYELQGINPAFFTLGPAGPENSEACVLQLTFWDQWFSVIDNLEPIDVHELEAEVMSEIAEEMANRSNYR